MFSKKSFACIQWQSWYLSIHFLDISPFTGVSIFKLFCQQTHKQKPEKAREEENIFLHKYLRILFKNQRCSQHRPAQRSIQLFPLIAFGATSVSDGIFSANLKLCQRNGPWKFLPKDVKKQQQLVSDNLICGNVSDTNSQCTNTNSLLLIIYCIRFFICTLLDIIIFFANHHHLNKK